jgi:hypothetical protein
MTQHKMRDWLNSSFLLCSLLCPTLGVHSLLCSSLSCCGRSLLYSPLPFDFVRRLPNVSKLDFVESKGGA